MRNASWLPCMHDVRRVRTIAGQQSMSPQGADSGRLVVADSAVGPAAAEPALGRTWRRGGEALRAATRWFFARGAGNIALQYHRLDREDVSESDSKFG